MTPEFQSDSQTPQCKTVLVVEDDDDIREMFVQSLEFAGYQVAQATNGKEALDIIPELSCLCLILLDLMMPIMNGMQFLVAKEKTLPEFPVVIISAFENKAPPGSCKEVLKKPIELSTLFQVVEKYCGAPLNGPMK